MYEGLVVEVIDILQDIDDGCEVRRYGKNKTGAVDRLPNVAEKMDVVRAFPRGAPGEDANAAVRLTELLSESFG